MQQLEDWTRRLEEGLRAAGRSKVCVPTVFTTAPGVKKKFEAGEYGPRLAATGVILSCICPLMYMNNPLCGPMPVIHLLPTSCAPTPPPATTPSDEILAQITKGGPRQ